MSSPPYTLVLVENEVTMGGEYDFWADDTGVQYQFPNAYRNRVASGRLFVYYRGVRRAGGRRGKAEYFGTGIIGDVWQDPDQGTNTPARQRRWFVRLRITNLSTYQCQRKTTVWPTNVSATLWDGVPAYARFHEMSSTVSSVQLTADLPPLRLCHAIP